MRRSIAALALLLAAAPLAAQKEPTGQRPPGDGKDAWASYFFAPELVMQHQTEIGLQDSQRAALSTAVQQAQSKVMDVQWKLSAEAEKISRLIQPTQVDEAQVLEQADRVLMLEREIKKAQISLLVKIKNTLTAAQQAKLAEIRGRKSGE
jgi:Spy/CpxP family protein refolding chaperone